MLVKSERNLELVKKRRQLISATASRSAIVMELKFIPLNFLLQVIPGNGNNMNSRGKVSIIYYVKYVELKRTKCGLEWLLWCAITIYLSVLNLFFS